MVAQWPELRKLTELRAAYQKYSLESKETAKTIMNSTEPDVVEVKSILATLLSQMVKIRDLNGRIQTIVKKDIFQWRNEVAAVVDFNLLWITHLRDLRRKCEASAKVMRDGGSPLLPDINDIHTAIETLSEKKMLPRTPSNEDIAEKNVGKDDEEKRQDHQRSSDKANETGSIDSIKEDNVVDLKTHTDTKKQRKQSDSKKQRKQSDSKKQRKSSDLAKQMDAKKQRKQSDSKKQRKQSDTKKQRKESESKKQLNSPKTDVASTLLRRLQPKNPVSREITVLHTKQRPLSWAPGVDWTKIPVSPSVIRKTSCLSRKGSNVTEKSDYDFSSDINQVVKGIRDIAERGERRRKLKTVRWSMDLDQSS